MQLGCEQSESGKESRMQRHGDAPHAKLLRYRARVQRAAAAESYQSKVARIEPSFDRDDAQDVGHSVIDKTYYARRRAFERRGEPLRQGLDRRLRSRRIDRKVAAQQMLRVEASQNDVCIGDRRTFRFPVTGWTGVGAG